MEKWVIKKLYEEFIELINCPEVTKEFSVYYSTIIDWVKCNKRYFNELVLRKSRLDILIKIDPNEYTVDSSELSIEAKSFEKIKPSKIDNCAMLIGDSLWNLMIISSGKDCPVCRYNELGYILVKFNETRELVLECENCGWCEHLNGLKLNEEISECIPARKKDLESYKIKP